MVDRLRQAYTHDLPRLVKELRWPLFILFALYLAGFVAGYHRGETTAVDPRGLPLRVPGWMFPLVEARLWGSAGWWHSFGPNTLSTIYGFLWGAVSFGLYSVRSSWVSGYLIGWAVANNTGLAKAAAGTGLAGTAAAALLPHGPFEMAAFWLAWALGWRAGWRWIRPLPGLGRWESARAVLGEFRIALLAIVPLLLVAALLATYTNPRLRDRYVLGTGVSPAMAREHRVGRPFMVAEVALAPDGETFAATAAFGTRVRVAKRRGVSKEVSTGGTERLASPAWSADGQRLALIQGVRTNVPAYPYRSQLKIVNAATHRVWGAPSGPPGRYEQAAWRPGEARVGVLLTRFLAPIGATDLWLLSPTAGRWKRVARFPRDGLGAGGFSWSPDGKQVVLVRRRTPQSDSMQLWVVNADGSGLRKLTTGERDCRPAWSPDGKWIAFLAEPPALASKKRRFTDSLPLAQIGLVRPDGSGRRDGLAKADEHSSISWSPDGKQLVYVRHLTAIMGTPKGL